MQGARLGPWRTVHVPFRPAALFKALNIRSEIKMNKFLSIGSIIVLAVAVSASSAAPSMADSSSDAVAAGVLGGMFGFVAGAAVAGSDHHHVYVDENYDTGPQYDPGYGPSYDDHEQACIDTYRSYSIRTDTYLGYDGYRHHCDL